MDSSFTTRVAAPASADADPTKRVNYTYGMVLGVDDFVQEQAYHVGHDEWLARDLVGYGTVNGLAVSVGKTAQNETEVVVTAGSALSPRGQLIRVKPTQCANLSQWLAVDANRKAVRDRVGSPPTGPVSVYVVLCYRACETDRVPIPGEPCRSEENATAASRLTDDFRLELRLTPPSQLEEDALRDFVTWLEQHVEFTDEPGSFTDPQTFRATLLSAAHPVTSPPSSPPDFMHDSPPGVMRVRAADSCRYLREAFRLWVTELRPRWRPLFGAGKGHEEEECLMLAELRAPLTAAGVLDEGKAVEKREERRPFVVHLRMLQEWLLCGEVGRVMAGVGSPPSGPSSPPQFALDDLLDVNAPAPQTNQVLTFRNGLWIAAPTGQPTGGAGGDLTGSYPIPVVVRLRGRALSAAVPAAGQALMFDGAQWAPTNLPAGGQGGPPTGAAGGDLTGAYPNPGVARIQARPVSAAVPAAGQVLTWDGNQWAPTNLPPPVPAPPTGAAGGDLGGTYPNPSVARLQTRPVSNAAPAVGQFLSWNGAQWTPANAPVGQGGPPSGTAAGDLSGTYPNPTVARLQTRAVSNAAPADGDTLTWNEAAKQWQPTRGSQPDAVKLLPFVTISTSFDQQQSEEFLFWFHLNAMDNDAEFIPPKVGEDGVLAFAETSSGPSFLSQLRIVAFDPLGPRNVFRVRLEKPAPLVRFVFHAFAVGVRVGEETIQLADFMTARGINYVGSDGGKTVTAFSPLIASRVG